MTSSNSDTRLDGVRKKIVAFARRHRGRISFYTAACVGLWFHSHGASGIGLGVFAIVGLSLAQDVDALSATHLSVSQDMRKAARKALQQICAIK